MKTNLSAQAIARLRWHSLSDAEKRRQWKARPRETGADRRLDLALIRRDLVGGTIVEDHDGTMKVVGVGDVTDAGLAILKACRTKGPPPAKKRDREFTH